MAVYTARTMRAIPALLGLLIAAGVYHPTLAAEFEPVPVKHAAATEYPSGRFIVKFRGTGGQGTAQAKTALDRMAALSTRTGVPLKQTRRLGAELQVARLGSPATSENVEASLALLRADPDVEFAEPDLRRYAQAQPGDPLFPGQWYLQKSLTTASAIDAVGAWDLTTGSAGVIVAVLDTGVRYEHPDLLAAGAGGKLLPGFDFVLDPALANDGDGWDADASDPGDWITSSEAGSGTFSGCTPSSSSWHGTRVSGIVGALANNSRGIAGTAWSGWILPVRGLGKCGGADSDIIAAMLWAGGVPVDGAPANPYPARIINMSLGGRGSCLQSYRTAVSQLAARGALVIASVGNAGGQVVAPANCPGVVGVGGLRHVGTKVGFSNLGPGVALSAPGGNCVNTGAGSPCLYSIDTTTNLGTTGPTASSYTDQFDFNVGTSFSAPIVSGIAALMLSVNNRLAPAQLAARLQEGATLPFPTSTDPTVPVCRVPTSSSDIQAVECVCTTQTCGAGMANALASVRQAQRPVAAVALPSTVSPGQNVVLRAGGSGAACGRGLSRYSWTIVDGGATPPGIVGADTDTATLVAPSAGSYTVRLTVTDDAGDTDSADVIVTPNAATTTAPSAAGGPACPTPITVTLPVTITITPASVSLVAGVGTQGFTASVSNAADPRVDWFVNDVPGGDATVGTISAAGFYTAPATRPSPASVTVKAVSVADSSRSASATVTIASPAPVSGGGSGGGGGGGGGRVDLTLLLSLGLGLLARRQRHRP